MIQRGIFETIFQMTSLLQASLLQASLLQAKLVRLSQIVQSITQDCKYVLSHLLPVCNLLVQGQLLFIKTVLKFIAVF